MTTIVHGEKGEKMLIHKTMAMPTSCLSCWIAPTCEVWVREKSKYKGYDDRLDECPLEEVKHGHWIEHEFGLICSECGHYTEAMYDEPFNNEFGRGWAYIRPYYCGYCGAKMDEVEENG